MAESTVTTEQLIAEVAALREQSAKQAAQRHKLNNELTLAMGNFAHQAMQSADRMGTLESSVRNIMDAIEPLRTLASDLNAIKQRLIGDEKLKSEGLIQQTAANERRLVAVEAQTEANASSIKYFKWERRVVFAVLVAVGGIITWIKGTRFLEWLGS